MVRPKNRDEGDAWVAAWCGTCRMDREDEMCGILGEARIGLDPPEWQQGPPWSMETAIFCSDYERKTMDEKEKARYTEPVTGDNTLRPEPSMPSGTAVMVLTMDRADVLLLRMALDALHTKDMESPVVPYIERMDGRLREMES